jgi:hypothetical protein
MWLMVEELIVELGIDHDSLDLALNPLRLHFVALVRQSVHQPDYHQTVLNVLHGQPVQQLLHLLQLQPQLAIIYYFTKSTPRKITIH